MPDVNPVLSQEELAAIRQDHAHCEDECAVPALLRHVEALQRQRDAFLREQHEIDQILGKALGYPEADESVMEKPDGSVVTGDSTPVSLAMEAANRAEAAEKRADRLAEALREVIRTLGSSAAIETARAALEGAGE